jgi:2,3-bisphosphoglycerate-dependent phosphoglycerate mutase
MVFSSNAKSVEDIEGGERETRVLLMRHAETSAPDRFHGAESDIGLGARGLEQAKALARCLAEVRPDVLISSPMRRALDTAALIAAACGLAIEIAPGLHERRMGALSGASKADHWDTYAQEKDRWIAGDLGFAHADAETFSEVRDRSVHALRDLVGRFPGRTIAVVAHGVLIKIALTSLLDGFGPADFDRIGIDTASVNDLRWDGFRWRAEVLNAAAESISR